MARNVRNLAGVDATQALGSMPPTLDSEPRDGIGAFVGPDFVASDIAGYLAAWRIRSADRPRLALVR